ncbi:HSR1 protein [Zopfochytrium polystomum]|nr:HSR1 protein [Zopfochytrium polystomum]
MSVFAKLTSAEIEERKRASRMPLKRVPPTALEIGMDDLYPNGAVIDFPKRPPWSPGESKETLESREEAEFAAWMGRVYDRWPAEQLSYFEHNLEVWRQLWRVVEISDIVLFVVDSRHPILHFPPTLYNYVVNEMKKSLVLVFNKIDLVDPETLAAWKSYFKSLYPELHLASFSVYPREAQIGRLVLGRRRRRRQQQQQRKRQRRAPSPKRFPSTPNRRASASQRRWRGTSARSGFPRCSRRAATVEAEEELERAMMRSRKKGGKRGRGMMGFEERVEEEAEQEQSEDDDPASEAATSPEDVVAAEGLVTIGPRWTPSSLINGIMSRKVVSTSSTPGHTKHFQTIHLTKNLRLCDCPGLVFPSVLPKPLQILSGMYKIAQVQEPYSAVQYLAERVPIERVLKLKLPEDADPKEFEWSAWSICEEYALSRGFLTPRVARPDVYRAANLILRMANDGRLLLGFKPPGFFVAAEAARVERKRQRAAAAAERKKKKKEQARWKSRGGAGEEEEGGGAESGPDAEGEGEGKGEEEEEGGRANDDGDGDDDEEDGDDDDDDDDDDDHDDDREEAEGDGKVVPPSLGGFGALALDADV